MMAGVLAGLLLAGCGGAGTPSETTKTPDGIEVNGTLALDTTSLTGGTLEELMSGSKPCAGSGGYDDIREGAQVTVSDEKGTTVGLGSLGPGKYGDSGCVFSFTVKGVEEGHPFYGIEVSHRGVVRFEPDRVASPRLSLG